MIGFGQQLDVRVVCPDCGVNMSVVTRSNPHHGYYNSYFRSVVCNTESCMNYGFVSTVEVLTGQVIFTDAQYKYDSENGGYKPMYPKYE